MMSTKHATVKRHTALQALVGWSGGKPAITKAEPTQTREAGAILEVDDGVVTSSAVPEQHYYWIKADPGKPFYYVKKEDVDLK